MQVPLRWSPNRRSNLASWEKIDRFMNYPVSLSKIASLDSATTFILRLSMDRIILEPGVLSDHGQTMSIAAKQK
jgi:hypothetical protein